MVARNSHLYVNYFISYAADTKKKKKKKKYKSKSLISKDSMKHKKGLPSPNVPISN